MNWKRAFLPALIVLPFLGLLATRFGTDPHALPNVLIGQPAPPFELRTLEGEPITTEALRGKPVVLNFWSTWCVPCKTEHEILQEGAKRWGDRVQFLGVVYQDSAEAAQKYLRTRRNLYPNLADPTSQVAIEYGVSGVPESFFIDAEGRVRHKAIGPVTLDLLATQINAMLAEGGT